MTGRVRKLVAALYGITSHALFCLALGVMFVSLYDGMSFGSGRLQGTSALLANTALALQFPLLHSFLLSTRGRALLAKLAPLDLGRDLASTTFAAITSAQLLATFVCWSPSHSTLFEASGSALWMWNTLYGLSWLALLKSILDAGAHLQTGYIGWSSVLRGKRPEIGSFPTHGLFSVCRQPIYFAYALTLWTGPVHTLDITLLALVWTTYCVLGPLHKERRYAHSFGAAFERYRERVPYFLPGYQR